MAESEFPPHDVAGNLTCASCVVSMYSTTLGVALRRNVSVRPVVDEGPVRWVDLHSIGSAQLPPNTACIPQAFQKQQRVAPQGQQLARHAPSLAEIA
eukprot:8160656-Pyramimonas_sp.AAC.1